jgi:hypothetical protein
MVLADVAAIFAVEKKEKLFSDTLITKLTGPPLGGMAARQTYDPK